MKENKKIAYGTMGAWAVFKGSKHPEAAAQWVEFLISPENNIFYNKMVGYMSPLKDVPPLYADDPLLKVLEAQRVYARGGLVAKEERRVMDVIKGAQQDVLTGKTSIVKALNDAERDVNAILQGS